MWGKTKESDLAILKEAKKMLLDKKTKTERKHVLQAYKNMDEQNLIIKTHIWGARCLKFEALVAHALTIKLKENAKKMLRGELVALAGGLVDESDVQPALLQAAKELLD